MIYIDDNHQKEQFKMHRSHPPGTPMLTQKSLINQFLRTPSLCHSEQSEETSFLGSPLSK